MLLLSLGTVLTITVLTPKRIILTEQDTNIIKEQDNTIIVDETKSIENNEVDVNKMKETLFKMMQTIFLPMGIFR